MAAAKPPAKKSKVAKEPEVKRPVGRPSAYRPEYCEVAIELGKQGKSPASIAANIGVPRQTVVEWASVHPEFSAAMALAKTFEQDYWENLGANGLGTPGFNSTVWKVSMAARFRHDYMEMRKTEVSGPDGAPVQVQEIKQLDASAMSPEQRDALRAALKALKD